MNAPALRHPVLELVGRYRAVLAAAWSARHDLAGPRRLADETAFLPAALSLQETPVHPAPRRAAWAIMAVFAFAIAWACIGEIDIVAVARGRIVVRDGTKVVQPLDADVVKAILVRDGDRVEAGQVLIELDPTVVTADAETVSAQIASASAEVRRTTALLDALATGLAAPPAPTPGDPQLKAEWADVAAKLARLDADRARRSAESQTARAAVAKVEATLPMARQREAELVHLASQGFISTHSSQDRMRERVELEQDLATLRARLVETEAALEESMHARLSFVAEVERALHDRRTKATLELRQLEHQDSKSRHRRSLTQLRSPVTGRVQQLAVHSTGGVVTAAQALMVVVPEDAEVTAEVVIENKDIGFVRVGQAAELKLDAFNFTRYGTLAATVTRVNADAVTAENQGPVYLAEVRLSANELDIDGKAVRLSPGMAVTAEVQTGKRRLVEYFSTPVHAVIAPSGKER